MAAVLSLYCKELLGWRGQFGLAIFAFDPLLTLIFVPDHKETMTQ